MREKCCDFVLVNLFRGPRSGPMRPGALNELLTARPWLGGAEQGTVTLLRHAFGSNVLDAVPDEAQALLGHISPASTQVYLHPSGDRLRQGSSGSPPPHGPWRGTWSRTVTAALARALPRPAGSGAMPGISGSSRPGLLAAAGWDPQAQALAPSPDHPLLGFRVCLVRGCQSQGLLPEELCATCRGFYRQASWAWRESSRPGRFVPGGGEVTAGERAARVRSATGGCSCAIPMSSSAAGASASAAAFLAHPEARPLPTFGPCQVTVCTRQAHGRRGLCRAHDCSFAGGAGTRGRSPAPISVPGAGPAHRWPAATRSLRAGPAVQAQILFGLQAAGSGP